MAKTEEFYSRCFIEPSPSNLADSIPLSNTVPSQPRTLTTLNINCSFMALLWHHLKISIKSSKYWCLLYFWTASFKTRQPKIESVLSIGNTNILAQEWTFYDISFSGYLDRDTHRQNKIMVEIDFSERFRNF